MRTITQHPTTTKIVAALGAFLLLGGVAWAATRPSTTIHACYSKRSGALRVASHCKRSEHALSWNQIGPTGARGVRGATGARGTTGARGGAGAAGTAGLPGAAGPSDVYAAGQGSGTLTASYQSLGEVALPAGSYLIEGKANFFPTEIESEMQCELSPDASGAEDFDFAGTMPAEGAFMGTASLSAVQTFATAQTVDIVCKLAKGEGKFDDSRVTAVKTAVLHGSTPRD
jgi:hypothetical protein